jgi:hypothetical protein
VASAVVLLAYVRGARSSQSCYQSYGQSCLAGIRHNLGLHGLHGLHCLYGLHGLYDLHCLLANY